MSRTGKHKKGNVRIGVYLDPIRKAVAVYLADLANMSLTDIVWKGIETLAVQQGVMDSSGKITPKHKPNVDLALAIVKTSKVKG